MLRINGKSRILALTLALGMLTLSACGVAPETATEAQILKGAASGSGAEGENVYETTTVRVGNYEKIINFDGSLFYPETTSVSYTGESAQLIEWLVEDGDEVKKGDILATVQIEYDTVELKEMELALERMKSDYDWQLISMKESLENLKNNWQLAEAGSTAKKRAELEYQKAEKKLELYRLSALAGIDAQKQRIDAFNERIQVTGIVAESDGIVQGRAYLKAGEVVPQGQSLLTIYDPDVVWMRVTDSTGDIRYNMDVTIETGNKKNRVTMHGKVVAADNILPDSLRRGIAYLELLDMPEDVTWNTTQIKVKAIDIAEVLLVERQAVESTDGGNFVYLLEDGTLHRRQIVRAGQSTAGCWVLMGLEEGQEVVIGK